MRVISGRRLPDCSGIKWGPDQAQLCLEPANWAVSGSQHWYVIFIHLRGLKFLVHPCRFHHCRPVGSWREVSVCDHVLSSQTCFLRRPHLPPPCTSRFRFPLLVRRLFPAPDLQIHLLTGPSLQRTLKLDSLSSPQMCFPFKLSLPPPSPASSLTLHLCPLCSPHPHPCPDTLILMPLGSTVFL